MSDYRPMKFDAATDDDDTAERLAALADATPADRPIEVLSSDAGARRGIICWLWPSVLTLGAAGLQEVLGPGHWTIQARGPEGRTAGRVSFHFAGRARPFDFSSPHYARPQPSDLVGTPWGPSEAPRPTAPAAPEVVAAAAPLGSLDQLAQLAAIMRQLAPPPPPQPATDLAPILAALVSAQRGPDLAGLAAIMQQLRPEPQPSPILGIVEALAPVAGPAITAWAEAKAAVGGPTSMFSALAPVLGHVFGAEADDDDDAEEEAPAPAPERRVRRMTVAPSPSDDTPSGSAAG